MRLPFSIYLVIFIFFFAKLHSHLASTPISAVLQLYHAITKHLIGKRSSIERL